MKKRLLLALLPAAFMLILSGCDFWPLPFTTDDIKNYRVVPDECKVLPTIKVFVLPNQLTTSIRSRMPGSVQFGSNELRILVAENSCGALPPFTGRATMSTNKFPHPHPIMPETVANIAVKWTVGLGSYSSDFVYWFWGNNAWSWNPGNPATADNGQIDGGDSTGAYVGDPSQWRQKATQVYFVALALEQAGYIQEAMMGFYYVMVKSYQVNKAEGFPISVYAADGKASWLPCQGALVELNKMSTLYGKALGIKYVEGSVTAIGDEDPTYWVAPDYTINYGRFIPWTD